MESYTKQREQFIATVSAEGLPLSVILTILAKATTLQKIAELSCSSASADRDRVKCPQSTNPAKECLCSTIIEKGQFHESVPRIDVQEARIKRQLESLMSKREGFKLHFQNDPRGAVVKLAVPSGKYDDMGKEGLCVPARGLHVSFWEREERINQAYYQMQARRA